MINKDKGEMPPKRNDTLEDWRKVIVRNPNPKNHIEENMVRLTKETASVRVGGAGTPKTIVWDDCELCGVHHSPCSYLVVKITHSGDTIFNIGDEVLADKVNEHNNWIREQGGEVAKAEVI